MKKNWKYKRKVKEKKSESKTAEKEGNAEECSPACSQEDVHLASRLQSTQRLFCFSLCLLIQQPLLTASREGHTSSKHLRTFITCRGQTETVITSTKTPGSASPCWQQLSNRKKQNKSEQNNQPIINQHSHTWPFTSSGPWWSPCSLDP